MISKTSMYLEIIMDCVNKIKAIHERFYNTDLLIAYRGEERDFGPTRLMPSLFRNSAYIDKEKYLFELFCDYDMISDNSSNIEKAIETQHYAAISRMLDITFNSLVSLYFACQDFNEDGYVYIFGFPEHYSPHSGYIEEFYSNVLNSTSNITYLKNFKVFTHSYSNERIKAQKGGFIFFPGNEFLGINPIYYKKICIKSKDKKILLHELNVLFQIHEAAMFPEKEKTAQIIKEKFIQSNYHTKKLSVLEEVESCFFRIRYEIKLSDKTDSFRLLRTLRKEESDLLYYVLSQNISKDEKEKLTNKIKNTFKTFKILI